MDLKNYAIYLDLDGVGADFDEGIRRLGFNPDPTYNQSSHTMDDEANLWKQGMYRSIQGTDFFETLPFMPGALKLLHTLAPAEPIILTAAPKFGATDDTYLTHPYWLGAAYSKRRWVEERFIPAANLYGDLARAIPSEISEEEAVARITEIVFEKDPPFSRRVRLPDHRFICTTSALKQTFMHRKHSDHQVLIDDRTANCNAWIDAGGFAIYHTSAEDTIARLAEYVESKAA
ncbi:5'-3' deoxyribonucleotidase [Caulobacter phage CcrBL10]|uniref:5' nucleotidase n=1 Tax=Caulobacter phage CcrBL10 TaxID=2283269 RepID=A0A385E979_9CAUD|nr:5'-3' deoxyribonucleotidase [Caulobacter phage CcrBL10]AXQ68411.1 hypothetical protein CcrBL10_gp207c [Caulobacter phage CcrBL10]